MLGIPSTEAKRSYDFMRPLFRDEESLKSFDFPVEYMFKDVPKFSSLGDRIKYTLEEMDKYNIERALIGVSLTDRVTLSAGYERPISHHKGIHKQRFTSALSYEF